MSLIRISSILFFCLGLNTVLADSLHWTDSRRELKELTTRNHNPLTSYSYARKVVMQQIHLQQDSRGYFIEDVYCNKLFRHDVGPNRMPDHTKLNIEHTWPQSRFSRSANKSIQKADLHHLYPSDSQSNSTRGNHPFSEVESDRRVSLCADSNVGRDPKSGKFAFEPPNDHKGNVARALFYFSIRYDIPIAAHEEFYLRIWNYTDPVDEEELARNDIVESVQGNRNPFIDNPMYADSIVDF